MTEPVLLDTNGWIALLNASDTLHESARLIWTQLARERTPIIVTDWVVAETGNGLARFPLHFKQAGFRRLLAQD